MTALPARSSLVSLACGRLWCSLTDVHRGDSKSTTQKLSDETSSAAGSAKEGGQTYLQQAQDLAASGLESAQKGASGMSRLAYLALLIGLSLTICQDLANAISGNKE